MCTSAEIPPELGGYSNSCTMKVRIIVQVSLVIPLFATIPLFTTIPLFPTIYPFAMCPSSQRYLLYSSSQPSPSTSKTPFGAVTEATTQHGSFSGQAFKGKYYAAGSDDFRGYVWRIPSVEELLERREVVGRGEDVSEEVIGECCVAQRRG